MHTEYESEMSNNTWKVPLRVSLLNEYPHTDFREVVTRGLAELEEKILLAHARHHNPRNDRVSFRQDMVEVPTETKKFTPWEQVSCMEGVQNLDESPPRPSESGRFSIKNIRKNMPKVKGRLFQDEEFFQDTSPSHSIEIAGHSEPPAAVVVSAPTDRSTLWTRSCATNPGTGTANALYTFSVFDFWKELVPADQKGEDWLPMHTTEFDTSSTSSCMRWMMIHPDSILRLSCVAFGGFLILFDLLVLPLQIAQFLPDMLFFSVLEWLALGFWTIDLIMNFVTGYHTDVGVEMKPWKVARTYLRGWFFCDASIISIDLIILIGSLFDGISDGGDNSIVGASRSTRIFRLLRMARVVRLLRIRRLMQLSSGWLDTFTSELGLVIARIVRLVVFILVMNHYIACAWYAVRGLTDEEEDWLSEIPSPSKTYAYACAFHWSMTQFTPATQNLHPTNFVERSFATFTVMIALITFSTFLGKMTSAMTQLLNLNADKREEQSAMRRFFRERKISESLKVHIWHCYREQSSKKHNTLLQTDVKYFSHMPQRVKMQLARELYEPAVKDFPIFAELAVLQKGIVSKICNTAIMERAGTPLEEIITSGVQAHRAIVCTYGDIYYESRLLSAQVLPLRGLWLVEPVLWGRWYHRGHLISVAACRYLELHCERLQETMRNIVGKSASRALQNYALAFERHTEHALVLDVPIDIEQVETRAQLATKACRADAEAPAGRNLQIVRIRGFGPSLD